MNLLTEKKIIVALDIGNHTISTLIGEILIDGKINVIGVGNCISRGIHNGTINDLESIIQCTKKSINEAETMSKTHVYSVYLAISSKDVQCHNEIGIAPINNSEVTALDIKNVIYTAKSVKISNEHHIVHVIPQEYEIDELTEIKNPTGLSGVRIKAKVHLITYHTTITDSIIKSIEKCGIKVNQLIYPGLASSLSILTQEEKELGVCLIDIGGGTLDISIYIAGNLQHSKVIPYAGNIITSDIAYAFSTSYINAENIKIKYGMASSFIHDTTDIIEVMNISGMYTQKFNTNILTEVIESRCSELFYLVNNEINSIQQQLKKKGKQYQLLSGIVLTGGTAKIKLINICAEKIFNKKVRIGIPHDIEKNNHNINEPNYATVIGLLHYGKKRYDTKYKNNNNNNNYLIKCWNNVNRWIKQSFL
ncbi:MAG: cell division protein FtsA [Buchnera aphidicola (Eriosoma harunire)]